MGLELASEDGIWMPDAFIHNTEVTVAGTTFARTIEVINGHSITLEDTAGAYSVRMINSNNNMFDVENSILNPTPLVTVISTNSGGLIVTEAGGGGPTAASIADAVWNEDQADHLTGGTSGLYQAEQNYLGVVWIDTTRGTPGTTVGLNGTPGRPVDTLVDAIAIAASLGVRKYHVRGNITLTEAHDDWIFEGHGGESVISLNGQDVTDSQFILCELSGVVGSGPIFTKDCLLDGVSDLLGEHIRSGFNNGTTFAAGTSNLIDCYAQTMDTSVPVFDLVGPGRNLNIRAYSGGIDLRNSTDAAQSTSIDMLSGQVILDANNTAGIIVIRGVGTLINNSAGATVVSKDYVQNSKLLTLGKWIGLK
jgi:hypothetical protein